MEIQFLGHSCFRVKGKQAIFITDPYKPSCGLKLKKTNADIITVSHQHDDHNNISVITGTPQREKPFVVSDPGEYEISDVFVMGLAAFHDQDKGKKRGKSTIYIINIDGMRLVHLGDLGTSLTDKQLEEINGTDILFVPVGGTLTLGPKGAAKVVNQVEPRIVIPMHYKLPGLNLNLLPVKEFLEEMGVPEVKSVPKLVISKEKLPEEREVILLDARS